MDQVLASVHGNGTLRARALEAPCPAVGRGPTPAAVPKESACNVGISPAQTINLITAKALKGIHGPTWVCGLELLPPQNHLLTNTGCFPLPTQPGFRAHRAPGAAASQGLRLLYPVREWEGAEWISSTWRSAQHGVLSAPHDQIGPRAWRITWTPACCQHLRAT